MTPRITFIVPAYNIENYILACLNSISAQSLKDFEVLIIENGSTDNTFSVAKQYSDGDQRFHVIKSDIKSVSNARNIGLQHAQGEFVAFIDGDDFISPGYAEQLIAGMQPDVDIAVASILLAFPDEIKKAVRNYSSNILDDRLKHEIVLDPSSCNKLFRNSFIKQAGLMFDEGKYYGEDGLFMTEAVLRCSKIAICPNANYYYRQKRPGQITGIVQNFDFVVVALQQLNGLADLLRKYNKYDLYKPLLGCKYIQLILGRKFGTSPLAKADKKSVNELVLKHKDIICDINAINAHIKKNEVFSFMFFKFAISHGCRPYNALKVLRLLRNIFVQPADFFIRICAPKYADRD